MHWTNAKIISDAINDLVDKTGVDIPKNWHEKAKTERRSVISNLIDIFNR